jgi:hypothetical protein
MIKTALPSNADSYHMDNLEVSSMLDRLCEEEERLEGKGVHLVQVGGIDRLAPSELLEAYGPDHGFPHARFRQSQSPYDKS